MRHPQRIMLAGVVLALTLAGCSDERGGPRIVGEDGSTIDVTAATQTATPSAEVSSTIVPSEGTPSATPETTETATPEATGTAAPSTTPDATRTPGSGDLEEFEGVPYSTSDLQAALSQDLEVDSSSQPLCPETSVAETTLRVSGADGSTWALWVYPDSEAREADWTFSGGALNAQTDDCEPPTGLNYFNANVVLVLRERGEGIDAMRDALLGMSAD